MIGRTLFIYLFRRYLVIVVQFTIAILVISYIADITEMTRRFSSVPGYSARTGIMISALRVPFIVQTAAPFVILFSAITTLLVLNRKYELVIARSAGVSAWQFLAPLCLVSLLIGIVTVAVWNPLSAKALAMSEELETHIRGDTSASATPLKENRRPWLRQRTDQGATIIGAKNTARGGLVLSDAVFIMLDNDDRITERMDARTAELKRGYWELTDVSRYVRSHSTERLPTAQVKTSLQPEFVEEQFAEPEEVPFYGLMRKIEAARSFGLSPNGFLMQYHTMIALPVLLVAMTLIAAVVSMRFTRLGQSGTMIVSGIVAGFLLYVVSVLVKAFGNAGLVPPVAAAWFPVIVAMFFGVTVLLHKEDG